MVRIESVHVLATRVRLLHWNFRFIHLQCSVIPLFVVGVASVPERNAKVAAAVVVL